MKLTVETKPFRAAAEAAGRCIYGRQTIPILRNLALVSDPDSGTLRVIGTDLEVGRIETIGATIREPGSVTVPKALLLKYLKGCEDLELRIETDENNNIQVNEASFSGMSMESFPDLPAVPDMPVADLRLDYLSLMLKRACVAISVEESRFTLTGALLELEGKVMRVVSTDGHRIMLQEAVRPDSGLFKAIIPKFACVEMGRVESKAFGVRLYADENHLWFCWDRSMLLTRKLTGNFPDYQRVLGIRDGGQGVVFEADAMLSAVNAALPFANERSRCLRFLFNGSCTITAASMESGKVVKTVPLLASPASPVEISFDGRYVADMLRYCKGQSVAALLAAKSTNYWKPQSTEGPSLLYGLMPMKF